MKRAARLSLARLRAAEHRERGEPGAARRRRRRRDPRLRREPAQAAARVAVRREVRPRRRSGHPHRLQARGRERVGRVPGEPRHPPRDGSRARGARRSSCASPWRARTCRRSPSATARPGARRRPSSAARSEELGLGRVPVVMVSEAGASVYSASEVAREEFPDLDLTIRGAISIARRLQDPLAELVKVDPKSIGVGQYQHDVTPGHAEEEPRDGGGELRELRRRQRQHRVAVPARRGRGHRPVARARRSPSTARRRASSSEKRDLLGVSRFSEKVFEQAAGFLRIPGAAHPLDNTGIHPERYPVLEKLAARLGKSVGDLVGPGAALVKRDVAVPRRGRAVHVRRHREGARAARDAIRASRSSSGASATTSTS